MLGYPNGHLAFLDCRVLSSSAAAAEGGAAGGAGPPRVECGVWKSLEAHSKGPMTALVGHAHAPLLATATAQQVRAAFICFCMRLLPKRVALC